MASLVASAGASPPPPPHPRKSGPPAQVIIQQEEEEEEQDDEHEERQFLPEQPRTSHRKENFIWQFFKIPKGQKKVNARYVTCLICQDRLSRGTDKKYSFGNYTMHRHMTRWHPNNYSAAQFRNDLDNGSSTVAMLQRLARQGGARPLI